MLDKLTLASLSCVAIQGCSTDFQQEPKLKLLDIKPVVSIQTTDDLTTRKQKQWRDSAEQLGFSSSLGNSQSFPLKELPAKESDIENRIPLNGSQHFNTSSLESIKQGNFMALTPTGKSNALGNPLYQLGFYSDGQLVRAYTVVTGRAYTQNRNRHKSGTEAPLPDGLYKVAKSSIPGINPEVGKRFLAIQPLFRTGRTELGIHYDPSFEQRNGQDGTSGCIALTNKSDLDDLLNYVRIYQPEYLTVSIQ